MGTMRARLTEPCFSHPAQCNCRATALPRQLRKPSEAQLRCAGMGCSRPDWRNHCRTDTNPARLPRVASGVYRHGKGRSASGPTFCSAGVPSVCPLDRAVTSHQQQVALRAGDAANGPHQRRTPGPGQGIGADDDGRSRRQSCDDCRNLRTQPRVGHQPDARYRAD